MTLFFHQRIPPIAAQEVTTLRLLALPQVRFSSRILGPSIHATCGQASLSTAISSPTAQTPTPMPSMNPVAPPSGPVTRG